MKTVKDLVPGDPDEIWLLADSYNRMASKCEELGRGFRGLDDGGWRGRAALAFHAQFEQQPRRFLAMADSYGQAAAALDTYASVLAWTQRQAGEVIALESSPPADPPALPSPAPTPAQQVELTGVITGADEPPPVHVDQRAQAFCMYRRALALLATVGNESATTIVSAAESLPTPVLPSVEPVVPRPDLVVRAVVRPPAPSFDHIALRDDLQGWSAAIKDIRKRLRSDGLDRLSPRLSQHIFSGHHRPSRQEDTGYHHREGGVDREALRVVEIIDGPDPAGVYVARVSGPRSSPDKIKTSTFFPDAWSRAKVLRAIRHAFNDAMRNNGYDPDRSRFRGEYEGVQIVGHLKRGPAQPKLCDIVTAYPRGVSRRRQRQ